MLHGIRRACVFDACGMLFDVAFAAAALRGVTIGAGAPRLP